MYKIMVSPKKLITILWLSFLLFVCQNKTQAQLDSIFNQGVYRTYIVHLPIGYNSLLSYPLVLNLHGLSSNAAQQQLYSQFDNIADSLNFIVVYPNALNTAWSINDNTDVIFLTNLIDTLKKDFSLNSGLCATGMSMGGFMSYKLGCTIPLQLNAIAVVTGNMANALQNATPTLPKGLPVMHFHGTLDLIVNYNGAIGISSVENTVNWWVTQDSSTSVPVITSIPNTNLTDNSYVEKYYYGNGRNNSEVIFYKIYNGGHTWPGAMPIPLSGNTNMDINASVIIGDFFKKYCPLASDELYWNGSVSTAWENPLNWNGSRLPTINSNVVIPSQVPRFPVVSNSTEVKSIKIKPGATIKVNSLVVFKVNGR